MMRCRGNSSVWELTALDQLLRCRSLGADVQQQVVGEADDLLGFGLVQAHAAGVRPAQHIHHSGGGGGRPDRAKEKRPLSQQHTVLTS